jgi:hypothetical protein
MATGLVQAAWLLRAIRESAPDTPLFFRWEEFAVHRGGLVMWEAFVSGKAKGADHKAHAGIGVKAFCDQLPDVGDTDADATEEPLSLIAAAAFWAGWEVSREALRTLCTLVRAVPEPPNAIAALN